MKAAVAATYGPPEVLRLQEVATPTPKDHEVLIRIHATTVSAVDYIFRGGRDFFARLATGITKPKNPTLGSDLAGVVEAVGPEVTRFKPGDEVFGATNSGAGAHAEYVCVPEDGVIAHKPTNISYGEATALSYGGLTALPFLRDTAELQAGQHILINGASGAIGTVAVQLARYYGAEVTGVCSGRNVKLVKSLGADHVIDYNTTDFTTQQAAYDVIFDTVGKSSFSRARNALKPGGRYLTPVLTAAILREMLWTSWFGNKKALISFTGLRAPAERKKDLLFLKELIEAGKLKAVIDNAYPLDEIVEAHRHAEGGHKRGNVVVTM